MILEIILALTLEQAASLYAVAYGQYGGLHGGVPLPDKPPVIELVPQAKLQEMYNCQHCGIQGIQFEDRIYLNEALDFNEPFPATVLVHEYIHYFQYVRDGPAMSCQDALNREHEAYGVQLRMMERAGLETMGVRVAARSLRCPTESAD